MTSKKKTPSVIFMGRKDGALRALEFLIDKKVDIRCIVNPTNDESSRAMRSFAKKHGIRFFSDDAPLYALVKRNSALVRDVDLVISYLYSKRIRQPLIDLGKRGCINYHPAPLPDYKSRAGYNTAILGGRKKYGVSVHFIDSEQFDNGPIIEVSRFPIEKKELAYTLEKKAQEKLLALFKKTVLRVLSGFPIRTKKNKGGLYLTGKQLEAMKEVGKNERPEMIDRKIRAFFFPPYSGATMTIHGKKYTLINEDILAFLSNLRSSKQK